MAIAEASNCGLNGLSRPQWERLRDIINLPSGPSQHLHHLQVGILLDSIFLVADCVLHDDKVARQIDPNCKRGSAADYINLTIEKTLLYK